VVEYLTSKYKALSSKPPIVPKMKKERKRLKEKASAYQRKQ
jgi:hypothetical protein